MKRIYLPAALLLLVTNCLMISRMAVGGVRLDRMQPTIKYYLTLQMEAVLHGEPANIKTYLPSTGEHQTVEKEKVESSHLAYSLLARGPNRRALWQAEGIRGHELAIYDAVVEIHPRRYELPEDAAVPESYPAELSRYHEPTEAIQSDAEEIRATVERLLAARGADDVASRIRALYDFVHEEIEASEYENTLDALTTLRWGEAFCGGKSRLLTALLRAAEIPARMVGGLILTPGSKRVSHAWVEAWVNGVWVPLDPLNGHFAEHPANYLVLYYGDQVLFSRTSNINFQYRYNIRKWRSRPDESLDASTASFLNPYVFWQAFEKAHISLNLLRIILLLPIGVLAVVLFRNVVGLTTFGTFHPALIAVAFRETGLMWGALLYGALLVLGMLVRNVLDRVELLYTPRLAIVLVFVVVFMLAVTYGSVSAGAFDPAHFSMFPMAILALTIESFFRTFVEHGRREALLIIAQTLFVVACVYVLLDNYLLQAIVFVFPEVLLGVVAANLVIGRWTGMRLSEYGRFNLLLAR